MNSIMHLLQKGYEAVASYKNEKRGKYLQVEEWLGKENSLGVDIWNKKYKYKNESFDQWLDRVSGGNKQIRKLIEEKKFLFGGRILSNRGLENTGKKISLSNCYVMTPPEDNIESIFECAKKLARTYSYGGGCGVDISKLCPNGAKVKNAAEESTGAVSFMDLYSMVTGVISQRGRRGALMISISCDHPDLEEFIEIKSDLDRVTKANISIRITNEFMNAVKNKEKFTLSFTREATGETIEREIDAFSIFHKLCKMNWDYAEPGMLFWDTIESWNMLSCDDTFEYAGVNPCVSGDTVILTRSGYKKIEDVVGKKIDVWNGYQYSSVTPKVTGRNQKMKRVHLSDGSVLDCTHYHKFILNDGQRVMAKDLSLGDKLVKHYFPIINTGNKISKEVAYTQGFYLGDGSSETSRDRLSIKLHGNKRNLIDYIVHTKSNYCSSFDGEFLTLPFQPDIYNKEFVPSVEYDISSRLSWLAGYLDSDGTIQSEDGSVSISSINREILEKVKYMLNTLGCNGTISVMYEEQERMLPLNNGTGEMASSLCKKSYRLLISSYSVRCLINLGLETHRVITNPTPNREAARFIYITEIEDIKDCETVYCFNEPLNHSGIFNGIITAQCAEEPLISGGSCLLGSINLSAFVKEDKTFDMTSFKNTVHDSVVALNEVLDEGLPLHPLKEQRDSVRDWRQIGLGIMGLADMLIKMGIRYGSMESIEACNKIAFEMANQTILTSTKLSEKNGAYPMFHRDAVLKSAWLSSNARSEVIDRIVKYGLRNSQLLTIAPTGSLSSMLGISGGIEPIYANYYERKTESLHGHDEYYKVYTPIVKEYMRENSIENDSDLPEYFVTAQTINYKERIEMQGIWQDHIDASISSTVNVPNSFTVSDVEALYMLAFKRGLKGITLFRDGCKRVGILSTSTIDEKEEKESVNKSNDLPRGYVVKADDSSVGKKRTLTTGCGTLHCEAFFDPITGELLETYLSKGSTGGCNSFMIGLSRMISLSCRSGVDIYSIVDQLNSSGTCPSYAVRRATKHDTSIGSCCPVAIGNALLDMYNEMQKDLNGYEVEQNDKSQSGENKSVPCPSCGEPLIFEGGCNICKSCGWSKCD